MLYDSAASGRDLGLRGTGGSRAGLQQEIYSIRLDRSERRARRVRSRKSKDGCAHFKAICEIGTTEKVPLTKRPMCIQN